MMHPVFNISQLFHVELVVERDLKEILLSARGRANNHFIQIDVLYQLPRDLEHQLVIMKTVSLTYFSRTHFQRPHLLGEYQKCTVVFKKIKFMAVI